MSFDINYCEIMENKQETNQFFITKYMGYMV